MSNFFDSSPHRNAMYLRVAFKIPEGFCIIEATMIDRQHNLKSDAAYNLSKIFTDSRYRRIGRFRYFGEIDGIKIGVVLTTKNQSFDNWALNKPDLDRGIAGKRDGRIDAVFVVAAKTNGGVSIPGYVDHIDAEKLAAQLIPEMLRVGRFGEFYVLGSNLDFPHDPDEAF
jgi:hypothetical protein